MFTKFSNKQQFYILVIGALVAVWISFQFAFENTIELKDKLRQREGQLFKIQGAPLQLQSINKRLEEMELLIGDIAGEDISPFLIAKAGEYCRRNGLVLSEIPRKHVFDKEEHALVTYKMIIKGSFKKLLRLCDELESNASAGKLRAVSFESEYNLKKGKQELFGIYYIQSVGSKTKD